ncbi:hypothetical protein ANCDUO_00537 [Ancylostoma duodenale]|uniref:Uncharacterized protein n=1 Tax=Ancylostoma duodenale TaxID=51022 RepID=A0A0C2H5K7_9BILA|nr:hypothetical protein ANCDUO_00537 [Ancylostoma duodenale]
MPVLQSSAVDRGMAAAAIGAEINTDLIGNRVEHAVVHLAGKSDMDPREFLPEPSDVAAVKQQMKSACALRNKKKLGKAPNGAGIWVEVVNDVGYRPLSEDAAKIRKTLDLICDTNDNSSRQKKMQWLMEMVTFAQKIAKKLGVNMILGSK